MAITKTLTVLLEVREAPDFFPASEPMAYSVYQGQMAYYTLSFAPNSTFVGRIRLSISSPLPAGSYEFSMAEIGVGETSVLRVDTSTLDLGSGGIDIVFEEIA